MNRKTIVWPVKCIIFILSFQIIFMSKNIVSGEQRSNVVSLPEPQYDGACSIERALLRRRSERAYLAEPLALKEVSQLLWAAQGVTDRSGFRTAPSAGALYPLELYLVVGNVIGLSEGVYKYHPQNHEVIRILKGDFRNKLASAALEQQWIKNGAMILVFTAVYNRTTRKYGERGERYVHIETGHAAQNVYLQAVSLRLGTVFVGAFDDNELSRVLKLPDNEFPLGIMPVGRIR